MKAKMIVASVVMALSAGFASADNLTWNAGVISSDAFHPTSHVFLHEEAGAFTDTIDFVLPNPALNSAASPLPLMLNGTLVTNILNLNYTIYAGSSATPGTYIGSFWGDNTSHNLTLALAGPYHIVVTGLVAGSDTQGAYALGLMSPVPEPQTYAMMLIGVGMLGYAARRRQRRG